MTKLAIVGAGVMGEALARGLLRSGWAPADLLLADVRADRLAELSAELGVRTAPDNAAAAGQADAVLLATKPQDAQEALAALGRAAPRDGVVSIVAGMRTGTIEDAIGGDVSVVRAMPNTPARVGKGVTALAAGRFTAAQTRALATAVFSSVGPVVWIGEEHLDAVTALSGSGPAYVFLVAEALVDAGVALGLPRDVAETLVFNTVEGSGAMLTASGEHPAVLRGQVTSPGGTTAAALTVLEAMAVRAAMIEAVRAAYRRSRELGE